MRTLRSVLNCPHATGYIHSLHPPSPIPYPTPGRMSTGASGPGSRTGMLDGGVPDVIWGVPS
ncbi:MAG: hypothetical protein P1P72_10880 [ANME-2 cluster archaeon]|nr:hypothetical protein [ANME-2 cluster archaeon]